MKLITAVLAVITVALSAVGQGTDEELARLRKHLSLSADYQIRVSDASAFPKDPALKVYIATGLDLGVRDNMLRWFGEWNRKNGRKYGTIEPVQDIDVASVVLARYRLLDALDNVSQTSTRVVPGVAWDPSTQTAVGRPVTKTTSTSTAMVPAYGYILIRQDTGLGMVWRYSASVPFLETTVDGEVLRNDLYSLMKGRGRIK